MNHFFIALHVAATLTTLRNSLHAALGFTDRDEAIDRATVDLFAPLHIPSDITEPAWYYALQLGNAWQAGRLAGAYGANPVAHAIVACSVNLEA